MQVFMTKEEQLKMIEQHVESLGEFFDSVQIFCSQRDPDGKQETQTFATGCGNWFARYGQIREWVIRAEESSREQARREEREPD